MSSCPCKKFDGAHPLQYVKTLHIVIAMCNVQPNLQPFHEIVKMHDDARIFVISKCGQSPSLPYNVTVKHVANVGRVDHAYLTYLDEHYYNLPDVAIFIKDSWNLHTIGPLKNPMRVLNDAKRHGFACGMRLPIWHDIHRLKKFGIGEYKKSHDQNPNGNTVFAKYPFYEEWAKDVGLKQLLSTTNEIVPVCYGGSFTVTGENMRRVTKQQYSTLKKSLERGDNIQEGHFMERSWALLLTREPSQSTHQRLLESTEENLIVDTETPWYRGMRRCTCDVVGFFGSRPKGHPVFD